MLDRFSARPSTTTLTPAEKYYLRSRMPDFSFQSIACVTGYERRTFPVDGVRKWELCRRGLLMIGIAEEHIVRDGQQTTVIKPCLQLFDPDADAVTWSYYVHAGLLYRCDEPWCHSFRAKGELYAFVFEHEGDARRLYDTLVNLQHLARTKMALPSTPTPLRRKRISTNMISAPVADSCVHLQSLGFDDNGNAVSLGNVSREALSTFMGLQLFAVDPVLLSKMAHQDTCFAMVNGGTNREDVFTKDARFPQKQPPKPSKLSQLQAAPAMTHTAFGKEGVRRKSLSFDL